MKQRIMSRAEIARVMIARRQRNQNVSGFREYDGEREHQAMEDLFFYVLADSQTVRIYNDVEMGGTVVEIVE